MKISDERMPQPNAKNAIGFAHLLSAQDFAQRGPLEIVLDGEKLGARARVEGAHRAYLPARVLAFSEDVPIGGAATRSMSSLRPTVAEIALTLRP